MFAIGGRWTNQRTRRSIQIEEPPCRLFLFFRLWNGANFGCKIRPGIPGTGRHIKEFPLKFSREKDQSGPFRTERLFLKSCENLHPRKIQQKTLVPAAPCSMKWTLICILDAFGTLQKKIWKLFPFPPSALHIISLCQEGGWFSPPHTASGSSFIGVQLVRHVGRPIPPIPPANFH
jgi:hypothetical protein